MAGAAVAVVAAGWALRRYISTIHGAFTYDRAPHDLAVFLQAAHKVVHGASPYAFHADATYAYPPLLAFLVAPLQPLGAGRGNARSGHCCRSLRSPPRSGCSACGIGAATRSPPPIRSPAVPSISAPWAHCFCSRLRPRGGGVNATLAPAAATGAAVALKLFLWPLVAWLALTGRLRAAAFAVGFAVALVLLPWAVLRFDGLTAFPGVLRRLSRDEATSSYSIVALAVRAHLPEAVGFVLSALVTAALACRRGLDLA